MEFKLKTKKLIELLQEEDPSGEAEVCICTEDGNVDILCLSSKLGYWDGPLQILERDWNKLTYNVTGAQYRTDVNKICIEGHSIEDAIFENPDLPVKIVNGFKDNTMKKEIDGYRKESKKMHDGFKKDLKEKWFPKLKENLNEYNLIQFINDKHSHFFFVKNIKKFKPYEKNGTVYLTNKNQISVCNGFVKCMKHGEWKKEEINKNIIQWRLK